MGLNNENRPLTLVSAEESAQVARAVRQWLNTSPEKPVGKVEFEWLGDSYGLCLSTVQSAYKVKQYIDGTYQAQYQFRIIYRTIATTADERLAADELLDRFASWCEMNINALELADNIRTLIIKRETSSALVARYEKDIEDHQIQLNLLYEVV